MKNNNVTTQDLLDMAQKELLSRDEIMVRLGIYSVPTYYQFINKIFDGMSSSKVYFFKVVHENVIRKKHEQKPRIELTTKDFPFLTFELNQMLKQGYTQIEIMNKYDIQSKYEFWNICKNLYAGNTKGISTLKQKLALNLQKRLLELSEKISQEEIAVFLKIKLSSFKAIKRQFFLDQEAYQIFNNNLKNFKKNKPTIKLKDEKNVKKNSLESDIAIIYHANYLNSLSSDELIKELNSETFSIAIIPQSFLRKVSSNYTVEYSKVFSIIIDGISSGRFIVDNFKAISTQEGSEMRTIDKESFKLAFSFIQKGYTPIIKSNNVITLVNAISLGIKVAHTNTHKIEIKNNNQISPVDINYAISYDADYLASHMESFQGNQQKIIFSFVLNDLIRKHCNSILYHIIDCIQDKENNIQIIYADRNNMLFKLLQYKLENNVHIILKTTNPTLRKDAINLGLLVNTDFTQSEIKTENIIQFNSLFSKNKCLDFIFRDGNYYVESSINFTVLDKEKRKKAFATVFDGKIYYKVEKGYYIKYKNGLIYKVSSFNKEDNLILAM